jgi:ABC-type polysaccharide/polyol phosphate transport system ATPase subunit
MAAAIVAEGLGKRYRLGERVDAYGTLRGALSGLVARRARSPREELWALRGVDLVVEQGEVVGVVGRNGAGKTTLLKLVARITEPTEGVARMRGRVGALLEVGTGFHLELTGRENVFFNGAVLGMSRREIERRFDEIVEFSGVERFLDTPLKRYSAGMYLRLAFSVAAHLEPDIIIVDEVLAVGDAEFRHKCMERIDSLRHEGRTILFVSHDLASVQELCSRCVLLDGGKVRADGPPPEIVNLYLERTVASGARELGEAGAGRGIVVRSVALIDEKGDVEQTPRCDQPLRIQVEVELHERIPDLDIGFYLLDQRGARVVNDALSDTGETLGRRDPAAYRVSMAMEPLLAAGRYILGLWIGTRAEDVFHDEVLSFHLHPAPGDAAGEHIALAQPPLGWELARL